MHAFGSHGQRRLASRAGEPVSASNSAVGSVSVAMANALISHPKLIILDEPVSALDVSIRAQIMNLLVDLQQQYNVSYLIIAHHWHDATWRMVAVMYLGKIVEARTGLFNNPLHPYTKRCFLLPSPVTLISNARRLFCPAVPRPSILPAAAASIRAAPWPRRSALLWSRRRNR